MGFGATLEVLTSRDFKVSGAIGLCTSLKRPSPSVSDQEIGEAGTCAWALGALDASSTVALYFDVPGAVSDSEKRLHLQLITRYQHSSGAQRVRVTTHQGRWAGSEQGALASLALSFDQEAAAVAMSRIVLDNVPNLQSSWVTMGMKVGQMALNYGCNDFGSLMIEENVVSAANTTHRTTVGELDRLIQDAGFTPARRRQDYSIISGGAQAHATVAA
jgi:hypothetical protein